jgi:CDP-glycerol glycerophosphotransferase (TagB/SpsB family)
MYDYDTYRDDDRGFYYDADYVRAGSIVKTKDELVSLIDDILGGTDSGSERRQIVRDRFDTYESALNSKKIVEEVLKRIHVV